MDDYTREMMDLKTLVTRTLEKKGVLAKIRAELRANVFEAIEEEDRVIEDNEALPPALLGSCNDRARQLHASPSGRLLSALICDYLDWAQLNHTLKVYQPECNLPKDSWKSELSDFSSNNGFELNRNGDSGPLLLDVLEGFLKFQSMSQGMGDSSWRESETESSSSLESRNPPRRLSASDSLPPQRRYTYLQLLFMPNHGSFQVCYVSDLIDLLIFKFDKQACLSGYRKDEFNWRHSNQDAHEEVMRAALENLQLDRKTGNLTSSWRNVRDGTNEEEGRD